MRRFANTDTVLGAAGLTVSVVLLFESFRQQQRIFVLPGDAPPFLVPKLFLCLFGTLSAAILFGGAARGGVASRTQNWARIAGCVMVNALAALLMQPIGFLLVAPLAVFATIKLLGYQNTVVSLVVAIGVVAVLYLLLVRFAQMPLPTVPGLRI